MLVRSQSGAPVPRSAAPREDEGGVPAFVARHERALLAAILLLALCVRVVFVLQMRASPYFDDPQLDQRLFVEWGRAVARGETFGTGTFLTAPLYAWFLGLVFAVTGESLLAARLVQAGLGTLAVLLVHLVARRVFGAAVGLLAALFAATYWVLVYYDAELVREGPANVANLLGILGTLALARRPSPARSTLAGLAFGASALLRQQVLLLVPLLALWLFLHARVRPLLVLLFLACVAAPILPVTAYNTFVGGDLVLVSAEGGQTLWIGNNPEADGVTGFTSDTRADVLGHFEDARAAAEREEGRKLDPSEYSAHYVRKTLAFFRDEPAEAARLLVRKLRLLVTDWEFGNPEEPRFFARRFAPIVHWLPLGFGVAAALGALGLAVTWRGGMARFPLWGFLLVQGATLVLFLVSARYRAPILPVLLIYSARGAAWLAEAASARAWTKLGAGLLACGLAWAGTRSTPVPRDASTANGLCWLAIAESRAGRTAQALELFEQSIALYPQSCAARTAQGVTLYSAGRAEEAVAALEEALRLCPQDVEALDTLAEVHLQRGRPEEAQALAERSVRAAPHLARGHQNLGRALVARGRLAEAADAFRAAIERKPDYFNAAYSLGVTLAAMGREAEAAAALAGAVEAAKASGARSEFVRDAYERLVALLRSAGRQEEAAAYARQLAELPPSR